MWFIEKSQQMNEKQTEILIIIALNNRISPPDYRNLLN